MYTEFKNHEYGITDTSRIHKLPFINVVDKFCYVMRIWLIYGRYGIINYIKK